MFNTAFIPGTHKVQYVYTQSFVLGGSEKHALKTRISKPPAGGHLMPPGTWVAWDLAAARALAWLCTFSHKAGIHSKAASQYSSNKIRSLQASYRTRPAFIAGKCYIEWHSTAEEAALIRLIATAWWGFLAPNLPNEQNGHVSCVTYLCLLTKMSLFPILSKKCKRMYFDESFVDFTKLFLTPGFRRHRIVCHLSKGFCSYTA